MKTRRSCFFLRSAGIGGRNAARRARLCRPEKGVPMRSEKGQSFGGQERRETRKAVEPVTRFAGTPGPCFTDFSDERPVSGFFRRRHTSFCLHNGPFENVGSASCGKRPRAVQKERRFLPQKAWFRRRTWKGKWSSQNGLSFPFPYKGAPFSEGPWAAKGENGAVSRQSGETRSPASVGARTDDR